MRKLVAVAALLCLTSLAWGAPQAMTQAQDAAAGAQILAKLPPDRLAQIPRPTVEAVLRGEIPAAEFARSLGLGPVTAMGTPTELQAKAFITHWLDHYTCVAAGINEDIVGESSIDGRCSTQQISDGPSAPYGYPDYSNASDGSVYSHYGMAPYDSTTCTSRTTNLTRYFVTWVYSNTARSAKVWFGASDYFKVWINGAVVLSRTSGGAKPWTVDEYKANVSLISGWNLIVVKHSFPQLGPYTDPDVNNRYKYFSLRFVSDDSGTPITNLIGAFDPNCTESDPAYYSRVWVPNVAHIPGYSSQWRSDLYLFNGMHMYWTYWLRFYKEGNNTGVPDAQAALPLAPFQTATYADVLQSLFGITADVKGYIAVLRPYYPYLTQYGWLQVKTFNVSPAGTFGTLNPIMYQYSGSTSGATFFGLRNGAYRSNLALFPAVNTGATLNIRLTLSGPAIPTPIVKDYAGINGFWQLNNVFADMGAGSVNTDSAYLQVDFQSNATGTYWFPYVTIADGNPAHGTTGTSDPVYLAPGYFAIYPPSLY